MKKETKISMATYYLLVFGYIAGCLIITDDVWISYIDNEEFGKIVLLALGCITVFVIQYRFLDVILHELGHMIMGLIFDWKIYSYNVIGLCIERKNNKFVISRAPSYGFAGFVEMAPRNEKQNIFLPLLGGIVSNVILSIIFFIVFLLVNNPFTKCICLGFVISNLIMAITNSIPYMPNAATKTDMYQIIELKESIKKGTFKYYMKVMDFYNLYKKKTLDDIDDSYFLLDVKEKSHYITILQVAYIDKLIVLGKFKEALKRADEFLNDNSIEESLKISLSFAKLFCMIMCKESKDKLVELFDSNLIKNNIDSMEFFMAMEMYAYYKLIDGDATKTEYYKALSERKIKVIKTVGERDTLIKELKYIEDYK